MVLIADSGSTKTIWVVAERGKELLRHTSIGLNPHLTSPECFGEVLAEVCEQVKRFEINDVYFFGAGCGSEESQQKVADSISLFFPQSRRHIAGDMLGACIAACGEAEGMVGIIGTGSNACLYDGRRIVSQPLSLGYILGDEGSGNHIGKLLLKGYFSQVMPVELREQFGETFQVSYNQMLEKVYREPNANRYLASFVPFAIENKGCDYVQNIVREAFESYFVAQILPLGGKVLNLVGSVAYTFQKELGEVANLHGISLVTILKDPIPGLVTNLS